MRSTLNARMVVALSVVVIVLIAAAFVVGVQQGGASTSTGSQSSTTSTGSQSSTTSTGSQSSTTSTGSQSSTSLVTGGSNTNGSVNLQLRLTVNASSTGGPNGAVTIRITADEYNTLAAANNVSMGRLWKLNGLSLGACGTNAYPFGVALYRGSYTTENASAATPLQIYPITACPMMIRLVTGYLFNPTSDLAVVLPGGPSATATQMSANVTAKVVYATGASLSSTPLGPGTYTAAAGDEWGSVVLIHITIGIGTSSITTGTGTLGTLGASFNIGPTAPVCRANASIGPAPQPYSSIDLVVNSSSGQVMTLPISWVSNGCEVSGVVQASLAPGSYSLNLSSCTFMGCSSALPKSFVMVAGQTISVNVSIDTGIR
jgi:hypothetical protein